MQTLTLFKGLFQQQGLQGGVHLLSDVFQQTGLTEDDAVLQLPHVVGIRQLDDHQLQFFLHVLHPAIGLPLRVDHQRPVNTPINHTFNPVLCMCVCVCVRACVRACARACVRVCVCAKLKSVKSGAGPGRCYLPASGPRMNTFIQM